MKHRDGHIPSGANWTMSGASFDSCLKVGKKQTVLPSTGSLVSSAIVLLLLLICFDDLRLVRNTDPRGFSFFFFFSDEI